jgi:hypothetical protein
MRTMFDAVAKPITSGIELCRATAPTALPMDHATEADNMEPTKALRTPRWESCDHIADMTHRSRNVYPPTASPNRTRSILNNSGHCLENCTGSRLGVYDTTISANLITSNSTNAILSTNIRNRPRLISTNSSHCKENCSGSHLENETTISTKITPSKPIRKSLRQNMVRNVNVYNQYIKKYKKEHSYLKALRTLCEGSNTNPAHKDAFNLLMSDLKGRKIRCGIDSQLMIMVRLLRGFYVRRKF